MKFSGAENKKTLSVVLTHILCFRKHNLLHNNLAVCFTDGAASMRRVKLELQQLSERGGTALNDAQTRLFTSLKRN